MRTFFSFILSQLVVAEKGLNGLGHLVQKKTSEVFKTSEVCFPLLTLTFKSLMLAFVPNFLRENNFM